MRMILIIITLLSSAVSFAQQRPSDKVYIIEGVVIDKETLEIIPAATLFNEVSGNRITTDEKGYFKFIIPFAQVIDNANVQVDVLKEGYKPSRAWFRYNPVPEDTLSSGAEEEYDTGVAIFYLAKGSSSTISTMGIHIPASRGTHGPVMVLQTLDEMVISMRREELFERISEGNEKVYFPLEGASGLATRLYDIIAIGKLTYVYLDGKKLKVTDLNKKIKRSGTFYDRVASDSLTKTKGKETIALRSTPPPGLTAERLNANIKAALEIELGN